MNNETIVITGIGVLSSLGIQYTPHNEQLRRGVSAARPITLFQTDAYNCKIGAEIKELPNDDYYSSTFLSGKSASRLSRGLKILLPSIEEAIHQSQPNLTNDVCGLVLGNTVGGIDTATRFLRQWNKQDLPLHAYRGFPLFLSSSEAKYAGKLCSLTGPVHVISNACASSLNAINLAALHLRTGTCRYMIAGGYEPLIEFTHAGFNALKALTLTSSKPFDHKRDGMFLGEGSAVFLMETERSANKRNADIIATFRSYGESIDTFHLTKTSPEGTGAVRAMTQALNQGTNDLAHEIAFIVAHATSTPANDSAEAFAILNIYDRFKTRIPVTALKPLFGHTLGAAGAIELASAISALQQHQIPVILNHEQTDSTADQIDLVLGPPRYTEKQSIMINSFGFGGINACGVFSI